MYNVYICIYIVNKVCSHPPQGNNHKVGPPHQRSKANKVRPHPPQSNGVKVCPPLPPLLIMCNYT